ncbi:LytR/AlgR family response regulator transcription factor [Galbibacter sp.]|uniref:LytR/AlgR family response regulator transcription factor n=1 Tax=Galbibacter sp. TaxID=2918471 RepID=UPI003A90DDF7
MSKQLTCIIVDDEPPAIRILEKYAEQLTGIGCIASTRNSLEALQLIERHQPDIAFLDIQMPGLTGIQLFKLINNNIKVIFTTAYTQFAINTFELDAADCTLKPISFDHFIAAVEKVKKQEKTPYPSTHATEDDFFFVKTDRMNRSKRVRITDVYYLESIKNYVVLHTENEQIVTYNTLKYFEENLSATLFIKIHKSFMVALNKVEKTDTNQVWVFQKNLPLGDTYKNAFFEKINQKKL